jgi:CRISPR type IV-associated protein Csf3
MIAEVRAVLSGPVLVDYALHLDGLLVYARARERDLPPPLRTQPLEDLEDIEIPLDRVEACGVQVYLCSAWVLLDTGRYRARWTRRRDAVDVESLTRPFNPSSGPGRNLIVTGHGLMATEARWLVSSQDLDEVERLVRSITRLGRCRGHGYGGVERWEVKPLPMMRPADTLVDDGHAMRALPLAWLRSWSTSQRMAVAPPYWHPDNQVPAAPAGTEVEILDAVASAVAV